MVHGDDGAGQRPGRGGHPVRRRPDGSRAAEVLDVVAPRSRLRRRSPASSTGCGVHDLLVPAGLASSTSEVNRLLAQKGIRISGRVADRGRYDPASDLLAGRYVLVRKGKRDHVLGKTLKTSGLTFARAVGSVAPRLRDTHSESRVPAPTPGPSGLLVCARASAP